jgi:peroxiredoxin
MSARDDHPLIGNPAPPFTLESADARPVSLDSHRGRVVVLFFVREFS